MGKVKQFFSEIKGGFPSWIRGWKYEFEDSWVRTKETVRKQGWGKTILKVLVTLILLWITLDMFARQGC